MAFLPMGLTLIILLRNSTKVPLSTVSASEVKYPAGGASPFDGNVQICKIKFTRTLYLSSPTWLMND